MIHTLLQSTLAQAPATPTILDMVEKGGVMMIPIGICSLIVVAIFLERVTIIRPSRVVPKQFVKSFHKVMVPGRWSQQDASELCKKNGSPAARFMNAGIEKLGHSHEIVEKHLGAQGENEVYTLRRRLRGLSVIAAVAPLLGLTGTIFGMIRAFQTVAASADTLGRAELLAEGIYEAMITTAAGLLVAMPALVLFHWLMGRVERSARELDALGIEFMERYVLEPIEEQQGRLAQEPETKPAAIANGVAVEGARS